MPQRDSVLPSIPLIRRGVRVSTLVLGVALFATPSAAHGVNTAHDGLGLPVLLTAVVGFSLLGGGAFAVGTDRCSRYTHRLVPAMLVLLGVSAVGLAATRTPDVAMIGAAVGVGAVTVVERRFGFGCGMTADTTLGAVTVHRTLEGSTLAVVYAADATLALFGALALAGHAAAETAVVGSLYATTRGWRDTAGAVGLVQIGFVAGVAVGAGFVDAVPAIARTALFGLVGGVLGAVGGFEAVDTGKAESSG